MVDPNAPQGLPPGVPPTPAAPGAPVDPGMQAPGATNPTTDPNALMAVLQAIMEEGKQQFAAQQDAALGTAVTQLMRQQANVAGEAASTMPGAPVPPPMPGAGAGPEDPTMSAGPGY